MNIFRTPLKPIVSSHTRNLTSSFLTLGSCFADAIGERLLQNKVNTLVNPFGTTYNPLSIHDLINFTAGHTQPDLSLIVPGDIMHHYQFHSSFGASTSAELFTQINTTIEQSQEFLRHCHTILLTYGTGWVYALQPANSIVANCHKQPSQLFTKSLLSQRQIIASFQACYDNVKAVNRNARFILTVSPVRHLKDSIPLNSVSKSILRVACHSLSEAYEDVEYFPAFEIMMDDLRDYRFYEDDMIHPSNQAQEYIWEYFVNYIFDAGTRDFFQKWKSITAALNHNPFNPESETHQDFLRATLHQLGNLSQQVDVAKEMDIIKSQLITRNG